MIFVVVLGLIALEPSPNTTANSYIDSSAGYSSCFRIWDIRWNLGKAVSQLFFSNPNWRWNCTQFFLLSCKTFPIGELYLCCVWWKYHTLGWSMKSELHHADGYFPFAVVLLVLRETHRRQENNLENFIICSLLDPLMSGPSTVVTSRWPVPCKSECHQLLWEHWVQHLVPQNLKNIEKQSWTITHAA